MNMTALLVGPSWAQAAVRNRCQLTHICRECWDTGVSGHGCDHLWDTVHLGPRKIAAYFSGSTVSVLLRWHISDTTRQWSKPQVRVQHPSSWFILWHTTSISITVIMKSFNRLIPDCLRWLQRACPNSFSHACRLLLETKKSNLKFCLLKPFLEAESLYPREGELGFSRACKTYFQLPEKKLKV